MQMNKRHLIVCGVSKTYGFYKQNNVICYEELCSITSEFFLTLLDHKSNNKIKQNLYSA